MYLRMPQGYLASGDTYTHRYNEIIKDTLYKVKIVDDTLLYDSSIEGTFIILLISVQGTELCLTLTNSSSVKMWYSLEASK